MRLLSIKTKAAVPFLLTLPLLLAGCTQDTSGQPANVDAQITFTISSSAPNGNYTVQAIDASKKTRLNVIMSSGDTLVNKVKIPANAAKNIRVLFNKKRADGGKTELCELETSAARGPVTFQYNGKSCGISAG